MIFVAAGYAMTRSRQLAHTASVYLHATQTSNFQNSVTQPLARAKILTDARHPSRSHPPSHRHLSHRLLLKVGKLACSHFKGAFKVAETHLRQLPMEGAEAPARHPLRSPEPEKVL